MYMNNDNIIKRFIKETVKSFGVLLEDDLRELGLFIVIPEVIARKIEAAYPDIESTKEYDSSPRHITLLIISKAHDKIEQVKKIIQGVLTKYKPFVINLCGTDVFENRSREEYVLYAKVISELLVNLHYDIRDALENAGIKVEHFYGEDKKGENRIYEPHMTLNYFKNLEELQGSRTVNIHATWHIDRIELWGFGSPIEFKFQSTIA